MTEEQGKKEEVKEETTKEEQGKEELTEEETKDVSSGRARCPGTADLIRGDLK